jgi:hypothetical protein
MGIGSGVFGVTGVRMESRFILFDVKILLLLANELW